MDNYNFLVPSVQLRLNRLLLHLSHFRDSRERYNGAAYQ